jgi:hypothetical protein
VRAHFYEAIAEEQDWGWRLDYGPAGSADVYLHCSEVDPSAVSSITVNRPCRAAELWSVLRDLLALGNGVFYFPGSMPIVAYPDSAAHLPVSMVEELGQPEIALTGSDLADAVRRLA